MKTLLDNYYKGFAQKANWEDTIADDFEYTGGDMNNRQPLIGKQAYVEVIRRFSNLFTAMRVKSMVVEGDRACVIGNYDYRFPDGKEINGDVAEWWTAENGKLKSLTIYFDTQTFAIHTKR
jgi:ketosteroid isomerase-like protein